MPSSASVLRDTAGQDILTGLTAPLLLRTHGRRWTGNDVAAGRDVARGAGMQRATTAAIAAAAATPLTPGVLSVVEMAAEASRRRLLTGRLGRD